VGRSKASRPLSLSLDRDEGIPPLSKSRSEAEILLDALDGTPMRIVLSPQARDEPLAIYRHAADQSNAARALHDKILSRVHLLLETPQIGRPGRVGGHP